jgi:hypothetical protein
MQTRHVGILIVVCVMLAGCGGDAAVGLPLFLYDHFPGTAVDASKWTVDTTGGGTVGVTGGLATLDINTAGGDMQSTLEFPPANVESVAGIRAVVTPIAYSEGGGSNVRFRLFMRAYKDSAIGGATGLISDIFAQIRIRAGVFEAMVSRCDDSACASTVIFGPQALGPVTLGQTYDLKLEWDGDTFFTFHVSSLGTASFDASVGGYANIGPPGAAKKLVEVNATSGAPTVGTMRTQVDWVGCRTVAATAC